MSLRLAGFTYRSQSIKPPRAVSEFTVQATQRLAHVQFHRLLFPAHVAGVATRVAAHQRELEQVARGARPAMAQPLERSPQRALEVAVLVSLVGAALDELAEAIGPRRCAQHAATLGTVAEVTPYTGAVDGKRDLLVRELEEPAHPLVDALRFLGLGRLGFDATHLV